MKGEKSGKESRTRTTRLFSEAKRNQWMANEEVVGAAKSTNLT